MIKLYLGNLGSSKTTNAVADMVNDDSGLQTYTNIKTKNIPNVTFIPNEKILKQETVTVGKKEKIKYVFNRDFWLSLPKPMNVIWDEIHFMADSRESSSQMNRAITEFVSMSRRIIGFDKYGYGDFVFIAQRGSTIDVRIRELVTCVVYHIFHWRFICDKCGWQKNHSSEQPNMKLCPSCGQRALRQENMKTERYYFKNIESLNNWMIMKIKCYYRRYFEMNISDYFDYFDTLQYLRAEKKAN